MQKAAGGMARSRWQTSRCVHCLWQGHLRMRVMDESGARRRVDSNPCMAVIPLLGLRRICSVPRRRL